MTSLDIVNLITNNPITKLNANNNNKLLEKVKANFTEMEQQLFIANFYTYLNYDKTADFIVDIDYIWKWLGFNKKYNAKLCLEKNFIINKDYKSSDVIPNTSFAPERSGAKNKIKYGQSVYIFATVRTVAKIY